MESAAHSILGWAREDTLCSQKKVYGKHSLPAAQMGELGGSRVLLGATPQPQAPESSVLQIPVRIPLPNSGSLSPDCNEAPEGSCCALLAQRTSSPGQ